MGVAIADFSRGQGCQFPASTVQDYSFICLAPGEPTHTFRGVSAFPPAEILVTTTTAMALSLEANLVEEVEDSPDFWSALVQSYNSPVEHRFLIGLDWSTKGSTINHLGGA